MNPIAAALCCAAFAVAPRHAAAEDALSPPPGSNLLLAARAEGQQSYVCSAKDNTYAWVYAGPAATLFDEGGREIGLHGMGPVWTLGDGSGVTGEVVAQKDALEAGAIPWLLLKVSAHVGTFGTLTNANYIRRIDTKGGAAPPDGCQSARVGDVVRIRYSAVYQFYGQ
jgi:hypothetical protein